MNKKLHIATYPLTNTIFVVTILKKGIWSSNKQDLTIEALCAVADHVLIFNQPVIISKPDGTPEYKITVERMIAVREN